MVIVKKIFLVILLLLIIPLAYSTNNLQYHNASQIYPELFGVGSYIFQDNINVTGNTSLGGYLHIGESSAINNFFKDAGDIFTSENIYGGKGIIGKAEPFGVGLMSTNSGETINFSSLGGTANMDVDTAVICDTIDPWVAGDYINEGGHEKMFFTVLSSSPTNYAGATGMIKDVINSSCIRVSVAAAGLRSIVDSTTMTYYVYKHPNFAVLDRGDIHFHVGRNEDSRVHVYIPDGRGFYGMYIDDTAGVDQHQALTIDQDGHNYDGIVGLNVYTYSSVPVDSKLGINTLLEIDGTDVSNSEERFIDMRLIGQPTNSHVDGIYMDSNIEHIIHVGSAEEITSSWYYDGTTNWNMTNNFTSETYDATIFENDGDVIYIANDLNFTRVGISLNTTASANILAEYYYCDENEVWKVLPGIVDTTAGFTTSGSISFISPSDRGKCNTDMDGNAFGDTTKYHYIAINRTRNFIVTPPIENLITIGGAGNYFLLQKDMMRLRPVDTGPETCDASILGAIYFDISQDDMCVCKFGGWKVMTDGTDCI